MYFIGCLHTGSNSKSSGDSGEYRDNDVKDFTPNLFVFHSSLVDS